MKLKYAEIRPLKKALESLSGCHRMVGQNAVYVPYEFSRAFTKNMVKNLALLKAGVDQIEEIRITIGKRYAGTANEVPEDKMPEFSQAFGAQLLEEDDIALIQFSEDDLNLFDPKLNPKGNVIPFTTIQELSALIAK